MLSANRLPDLENPEASFAMPIEIALAGGLTRGQRLYALGRWAEQIEQRLALEQESEVVDMHAAHRVLQEIASTRELVERQFGSVTV
jgi:hypothetical protein